MDPNDYEFRVASALGHLQGVLEVLTVRAFRAAECLTCNDDLRYALIEISEHCSTALTKADMLLKSAPVTVTTPAKPEPSAFTVAWILDQPWGRDICLECHKRWYKRSPNCPRKIFDRHPR